jgi:cell division control protein 24
MNQVLDVLVSEGVLAPEQAPGKAVDPPSGVKKTKRQHIIDELVATERTYVKHLEMLQAFQKAVEEKGLVSGDARHDIFHNLNALLDFQRRFLIRVEQTNLQREEEQNWGSLFTLYKDAFLVYEPYISNQKKCEEAAMREFDKLKLIEGSSELRQFVENPTVLSAFLLKPFQRLSKYPLLLKVRIKTLDGPR